MTSNVPAQKISTLIAPDAYTEEAMKAGFQDGCEGEENIPSDANEEWIEYYYRGFNEGREYCTHKVLCVQ